MKRRVFMLGLMCALFVSFMATDMVVADTAEAKKIDLVNRYTKTISVAVRYKDSLKGWVTRGWFNLKP